MGEILIKTLFSLQSKPHTAKLCYSVVLKYFGRNSQRTSRQKVAISERNSEILWFFFLNIFEKGKSSGKFGFV